MRDRLIELLKQIYFDYCEECCACTEDGYRCPPTLEEFFADYLLENGVIVPPCKVGDTIYQIMEKCICTAGHTYLHNTCNRPTSCQDCPHVEIKRWIVESTFDLSLLDRIDVDFFLTREQAEKALSEVKNGT